METFGTKSVFILTLTQGLHGAHTHTHVHIPMCPLNKQQDYPVVMDETHRDSSFSPLSIVLWVPLCPRCPLHRQFSKCGLGAVSCRFKCWNDIYHVDICTDGLKAILSQTAGSLAGIEARTWAALLRELSTVPCPHVLHLRMFVTEQLKRSQLLRWYLPVKKTE